MNPPERQTDHRPARGRLLVQPAEAAPLSARQLEVVKLAAQGFTNREIGDLLHISANSVKDRLKTAYARLGASNRAEAVHLARNDGLIDT